MNKKLLVSVLLCFFVFSLMIASEKKALIVEHLFWFDIGRDYSFKVTPEDYTAETFFKLDPFFIFHVPASPKCKAIFFELWAQVGIKWSNFSTRFAHPTVYLRCISDVIPDNIDVAWGYSVVGLSDTNNANNYTIKWSCRYERNLKFTMRKDGNYMVGWLITYKDTGRLVEKDVYVPIVKELMNNGFDVEVWGQGWLHGAESMLYIPVIMEVTRLSKD